MFNFSLSVKTALGRELITSFSMSVNKGDKIALIGEEGNGKSVLLKALMGDHALNDLQIEKKIMPQGVLFGYLKQELDAHDLKQSALEYLCGDNWDLYSEVIKLWNQYLSDLDETDLDRKLSSFSGGEKVKIQLMNLMLRDLDCFLLDEPTNNLDLDTLLWFEGWLQKQEKPVLFVSHDISLLEAVSTRVLHLEQTHRKSQCIVNQFEGNYKDYVEWRNRSIQTHNQNAENQKRIKEKQEERWHRLYRQVSHQLKSTNSRSPEAGRLLKKKMKTVKAMKNRYDREETLKKRDVEEHIEIFYDKKNVHHKKLFDFYLDELVRDHRVLARNLDLTLYSDEKIACMGPNGSGKTSFLEELIAYLNTTSLNFKVIHQDYAKDLDYHKNAMDNLVIEGSKDEMTQIRLRLGSLKFTQEEVLTPVGDLSGGQKAKILILKCVLSNPDLLILDEPTRNLSPLSVEVIYNHFKDFQGAIFCVSHDRRFIERVFDRVLYFSEDGFIDFEPE